MTNHHQLYTPHRWRPDGPLVLFLVIAFLVVANAATILIALSGRNLSYSREAGQRPLYDCQSSERLQDNISPDCLRIRKDIRVRQHV